MKKVFALVLALGMLFSLSACGNESSTDTPPASSGASVSEPADDNIIPKTSDGFPNKEITLIVASSAGAEDDIMIRQFAAIASKYTDVKILVENQGGGSGIDALTSLNKAGNDGYTMLTQSTTLAVQIGAGQTPYTMDDIYPLAGMHGGADCIIVKGDSPYHSLQDLIDDAKAHPGEVNWGAAKTLSVHHIFTLMVSSDADINVNYVAYDKAADAKVAVLNGDVQVGSISFGQIQDEFANGDIRILATSDAEHNPAYPDVPTLAECGLKTADGYSIYRGWFLKPGVPQERVDYLNELVLCVQNDPEWQTYVTDVVAKDNLYMDTPTFTEWFNNIVEFVQTVI